jgi:hypothetical protein
MQQWGKKVDKNLTCHDILNESSNKLGVGRTPWTGDQLVRNASTYTQDSANRKNAHADIHITSGIRTQDTNVWAGEDGLGLKPRG